ncbi:MAG: LPS export ABC transporter periplasmic protein LptC [Nitrospirota bacterium]
MKKILFIVLSVSLFGIIFMLLVASEDINGNSNIKRDSFIEGVRIIQKRDGIIDWTLNAKRADFVEGEDNAKLSDINMVIQKSGMILHSQKGIYNLSDQSLIVDGVVRAEAKDLLITSDSLNYEVSSGRIDTKGYVEVNSKKFKLEGKGMTAESGDKVTILDNVKAIFYK